MSDIELPDLPEKIFMGTSRFGSVFYGYIDHHLTDFARAAILADREKRAQAAQPVAWHVNHNGSCQIFTTREAFDPDGCTVTPLYEHPPTEACKPVLPEAPTSNPMTLAEAAKTFPYGPFGHPHVEVSKPVQAEAPYGYCPMCGAKGVNRERSPNGRTTCEAGHRYQHSHFVATKQAEAPTASNAERGKERKHCETPQACDYHGCHGKCAALAQVPEQVAGDKGAKP